MSLIDKLRKSRETRIEAGGFKFVVRRPTDLEATGMRYASTEEAVRVIAKFVVGWDNVKEIDIVPGGAPDPVQFDSELFMAWLEDQPELWEPLVTGTLDAYKAHIEKVKGDVKN